MTNYSLLLKQLDELTFNVPHGISNLANAAALLWDALPDINWVGFYMLEDETLILGPFQGKVACVEIPIGKGVCGAAAIENRTQLVADVHKFSGHIACDCASNSEIVVPLRRNGKVIGVLDIDSPLLNRFSIDDQVGLEAFTQLLESRINNRI